MTSLSQRLATFAAALSFVTLLSCGAPSCPSGCCFGATCNAKALDTCGVSGATCVSCDPNKADNCSALGTCKCGGAAACGAGQTCSSGTCTCDVNSCPSGAHCQGS